MRADDGDLVRKAQAGEECAFAALVERYRDMVYGLTYHYLGNFDDSRDAAQEAFVHSFLRLRDLRDPDRFAPWLRRTAMNVCADALRRRGARLLSLEHLEDMPDGIAFSVGAPTPSTDIVERLAAQMAVREALQRLSARTRLTVTLFYLGGYSHAEIARFLEIPVNTVRSRLQHAKRQLREEMQTMVNDTLNAGKPDPQFTRRVVEEALRRANEAYDANRKADTFRYVEEALAAIGQGEPGAEGRRLMMEALWKKGQATEVFRNAHEEAVALFEQAQAIAEELDDRKSQADKLVDLATAYSNLQQGRKAEECLRRALALYEALGDAGNHGRCLLMLGTSHLFAEESDEGKRSLEQALPLLEAGGQHQGVALCRAALDLLADIGAHGFPAGYTRWSLGGEVLKQQAGTVAYAWGFSHIVNDWTDSPDAQPLRVFQNIFAQIGHLRKFLDAGASEGDNWSGETNWSDSMRLQAAVTVKSRSERVEVPAGTFAHCLLIEQVTREAEGQEELLEEQRQRDRLEYCGARQTWYAPGVGLVQLRVQRADGANALLQLREFSIQSESQDYLPLAIGNAWAYGWANVPETYAAKDAYKVVARQGDMVFVSHYGYAYRISNAREKPQPASPGKGP
ncbi:MAG TPA: sigma-70 family RNA polymerase sigma factor [Chthonomonadaceae bacterium]|nr:sigma-70 family RNA polymerase sigma factor [Chthonomonadaceae bacterium]